MGIWTQDHIDTLVEAIASGVMTVSYSGGAAGSRTMTYQSTKSMLEALALMQASVAADAGTGVTFRKATFKKDL